MDIVIDMDEKNRTFTAGKPLSNLSSLNQLEAVDRRISVSMNEKYGKFNITRAITTDVNNFAFSLNNTLGEEMKKYIKFLVSNRHLVIERTHEQELKLEV